MSKIFNKQNFIIFTLSAFIFSGISSFATQYVVKTNQYPIVVNGEEKSDVDSLNVNGSTYLKLKDVGTTFNADVNFNNESKQIEITTSESKENNTVSGNSEDTSRININGVEYSLDINKYMIERDSVKYISPTYITIATNVKYSLDKYLDNGVCLFDLKNKKIILSNIPYIKESEESPDNIYISYNYFITNILPLIKDSIVAQK